MGTLGFLIVLSLLLGLGAWLAFLWSVRSGQYEDPEGPKYRMLDDDEPGAPPSPPGDLPPSPQPPPDDPPRTPPKVDR